MISIKKFIAFTYATIYFHQWNQIIKLQGKSRQIGTSWNYKSDSFHKKALSRFTTRLLSYFFLEGKNFRIIYERT